MADQPTIYDVHAHALLYSIEDLIELKGTTTTPDKWHPAEVRLLLSQPAAKQLRDELNVILKENVTEPVDKAELFQEIRVTFADAGCNADETIAQIKRLIENVSDERVNLPPAAVDALAETTHSNECVTKKTPVRSYSLHWCNDHRQAEDIMNELRPTQEIVSIAGMDGGYLVTVKEVK